MRKNLSNTGDFLKPLNFKLGPQTSTGLNTLVAVDPGRIDVNKLRMGLQNAMDEELYYQRQIQKDPNYQRTLHGWIYEEGLPPIPRNLDEYARAEDVVRSLSIKDVKKLVGGYGGIRGEIPSGDAARLLATDTLYNASYGIDTLTGAPLDYVQNAGHLLDFHAHGQGPTRPEQERVNTITQNYDGMHKLLLLEKAMDDLATAELYAKNPAAMKTLLNELPSSKMERSGWNPELKEMDSNAKRWHLLPMEAQKAQSYKDGYVEGIQGVMASEEGAGDNRPKSMVFNNTGDVVIGGPARVNGNGKKPH